ncbi:MAG: hypothetical protein HZB79_10095 [Deltaproteobacteria bacterium]|nr:hypothetical protein [Deltaproteobacteria bacterium]
MSEEKKYSPLLVILNASVWSLYEVGFALLPGIVWVLTLLILGKSNDDIVKLLAWPFISVSVYASILRDSIRVFCREDTVSNRQDREVTAIFSLVGVVLSSVLLTVGVCEAQGVIRELPWLYHVFVLAILSIGVVSLFFVKTIMIKRTEFKT